MLDPAELTWMCHVCKDERPDDKISVLTTDLTPPQEHRATIKQHVRYCNDRPECIEGAKHIFFVKPEHWKREPWPPWMYE